MLFVTRLGVESPQINQEKANNLGRSSELDSKQTHGKRCQHSCAQGLPVSSRREARRWEHRRRVSTSFRESFGQFFFATQKKLQLTHAAEASLAILLCTTASTTRRHKESFREAIMPVFGSAALGQDHLAFIRISFRKQGINLFNVGL